MIDKIHIIGAGGVGSWLTPSLALLVGRDKIVVHDGDTLEGKNLNRQLFTEMDIGRNKAEALAQKYGVSAMPDYFSYGHFELGHGDWIICCADNNPARWDCVQQTERDGPSGLIIAANETTSAEAVFYIPGGLFTPDIRESFPGMAEDQTADPRRAAIGCTGQAQEQNPQLVSANFMAASLAQWLFVLWGLEATAFDFRTIKKLPYKFRSNLSKLETFYNKKPRKKKERTV